MLAPTASGANLNALPQTCFDDLYTAVYELIDDAKAAYQVVKLYKGSHSSPDPHEIVTDFGSWFFEHRRGLFGYVCERAQSDPGRYVVDDLTAFDSAHQPRVSSGEAFNILAHHRNQVDGMLEEFLNHVADREHRLGWYRGGTSGFDDEARAFMCAHFRQLGIPSDIDDVMIFAGGAKAVFLACCAALMCHRTFDELRHRGGVLLAPSGYYQSLRLLPAVFGGTINVEDELTGTTVADWLAETEHLPGRLIYVPLVNNLDGHVLTRERAHDLAAAIVAHNLDHPDNPAYVVGDDVYVGSYLHDGIDAMPIGAAPGMAPWCVSVVTPSKTFTLPTGRVAFATARSPVIRTALAHYRTVFSHGRVPQSNELVSAAAICLTPANWVTRWNIWNREQVRFFASEITSLNTTLRRDMFWTELPQGGWYVPVRIARGLFGDRVRNSVEALAVLLYYGGDNPESGLAALPGELFGHDGDDAWFTVRTNLAVDTDTIVRTVQRFHDVATALLGNRRDQVVDHALGRAHRIVPDLDQILANRRY